MSTVVPTDSARWLSGGRPWAQQLLVGRLSAVSSPMVSVGAGSSTSMSRSESSAFAVALTRITESRDKGPRRTDVRGLVTFSASLFLIVLGNLRGNAWGWTSGLTLLTLSVGVLLLVLFVALELRQERPTFDVTLFRQRAFVGVSVATFCIAAGMFAMFPYLSIYLQDILGYSPLAHSGLRFLRSPRSCSLCRLRRDGSPLGAPAGHDRRGSCARRSRAGTDGRT